MGMDPAGRGQTHQVGRAAAGLQGGDELQQRWLAGKAAVLDCQVDLAEIHRHGPARADIGMADLGIAHLSRGQAHHGAMGDQLRIGAAGHQAVEIGGIGQLGRVVLGRLAQAPAVENAQDHGFRCHGALLFRSPLSNPVAAQREPPRAFSGYKYPSAGRPKP